MSPQEQIIYDLLELRERFYKLSSNEDIDDELLELANTIALNLDVDIEKIIKK